MKAKAAGAKAMKAMQAKAAPMKVLIARKAKSAAVKAMRDMKAASLKAAGDSQATKALRAMETTSADDAWLAEWGPSVFEQVELELADRTDGAWWEISVFCQQHRRAAMKAMKAMKA